MIVHERKIGYVRVSKEFFNCHASLAIVLDNIGKIYNYWWDIGLGMYVIKCRCVWFRVLKADEKIPHYELKFIRTEKSTRLVDAKELTE